MNNKECNHALYEKIFIVSRGFSIHNPKARLDKRFKGGALVTLRAVKCGLDYDLQVLFSKDGWVSKNDIPLHYHIFKEHLESSICYIATILSNTARVVTFETNSEEIDVGKIELNIELLLAGEKGV